MSHQVLSGQMDGQLDLFKTAGELRMMRAGDIAGGGRVHQAIADHVSEDPMLLGLYRNGEPLGEYMGNMHKKIRSQGGVYTPVVVSQDLAGEDVVENGHHRVNAAPKDMLLPVIHADHPHEPLWRREKDRSQRPRRIPRRATYQGRL